MIQVAGLYLKVYQGARRGERGEGSPNVSQSRPSYTFEKWPWYLITLYLKLIGLSLTIIQSQMFPVVIVIVVFVFVDNLYLLNLLQYSEIVLQNFLRLRDAHFKLEGYKMNFARLIRIFQEPFATPQRYIFFLPFSIIYLIYNIINQISLVHRPSC